MEKLIRKGTHIPKNSKAKKNFLKLNQKSKKTNTFSGSIRTKVFFLAAILILVAISINYIFSSYYSRKTLLENTNSSLYDLADAHLVTVEKTILSIDNALIGLVSDSSISDYLSGIETIPTKSSRVCQSYLLSHEEVDACSLLDATGTVLYSTSASEIKKSYGEQDFVTQAVEKGTPTQSSVMLLPSGKEMGIAFAYPVKSFLGEVVGLVTVSIPSSKLFENLASVSVFGTENSYAYLIDKQGNILFHRNPQLIGTAVNIPLLIQANENLSKEEYIKEIKDATIDKVKVETYTEDGKQKQMSYGVLPDSKWTLIITADESEITLPIKEMSIITMVISVILILILSFIGFLFAGSIVKPLKKLTHIINCTAALNLAEDYDYAKLQKSKDETASMAQAMQKLRTSFVHIVGEIKDSSGHINQSTLELNQIMHSVKDFAQSTASSTQELSASMQETFATAEEISSSIEQMDDSTKDIALQIKDGTVLSKTLAKRADEMKDNTSQSSIKTRDVYESMKEKTNLAIKKAESVHKINTLANSIKEIAQQTSLLSLNASIEAARAGESGKGFSVVASEIGKLANQSSETVNHISSIVLEVNDMVNELTQNLSTTLKFLDENVLKDYEDFKCTSEQYSKDAFQMNDTISAIHNSVKIVIQYMDTISHAVSGITGNVGTSTASVADIAQGNQKITELTLNTYEKIKESEEHVQMLKGVVGEFQLQ